MKQLMNDNELELVTGGNWFTDAWDATCGAVSDAWNATSDFVSENSGIFITAASFIGGAALCATGVGAAAGAGMIGGSLVLSVGTGGILGGSIAGMTAAVLSIDTSK